MSCGDPFEIDSHTRPDGTEVLGIRGELDLDSAPRLEAALIDAEGRNCSAIVLELSGLEFIDSTGIGVLVKAQGRAARDGRRFLLKNLPPQTARVLSIAGLSSRFAISEDGAGPAEIRPGHEDGAGGREADA